MRRTACAAFAILPPPAACRCTRAKRGDPTAAAAARRSFWASAWRCWARGLGTTSTAVRVTASSPRGDAVACDAGEAEAPTTRDDGDLALRGVVGVPGLDATRVMEAPPTAAATLDVWMWRWRGDMDEVAAAAMAAATPRTPPPGACDGEGDGTAAGAGIVRGTSAGEEIDADRFTPADAISCTDTGDEASQGKYGMTMSPSGVCTTVGWPCGCAGLEAPPVRRASASLLGVLSPGVSLCAEVFGFIFRLAMARFKNVIFARFSVTLPELLVRRKGAGFDAAVADLPFAPALASPSVTWPLLLLRSMGGGGARLAVLALPFVVRAWPVEGGGGGSAGCGTNTQTRYAQEPWSNVTSKRAIPTFARVGAPVGASSSPPSSSSSSSSPSTSEGIGGGDVITPRSRGEGVAGIVGEPVEPACADESR